MLKTSELLERFNNPQLINQDINNLCQQKLAGIDMEKLALSFNPGNLLKTLKSKPFVSRLSRDLGGAAAGAVPGALIGGMANSMYHGLTDEKDPNATFTDRLLQGAKNFGTGAIGGAVLGAGVGGLRRHLSDSGKLKPVLEELAKHEDTLKKWSINSKSKEKARYLHDSADSIAKAHSVKNNIQGSNFGEGFKNTFNEDLGGYMNYIPTWADFLEDTADLTV